MKNKVADYIITGMWAKKAYAEAQLYGKANAIASSADKTFSYIPDCSDLQSAKMQTMFTSVKTTQFTVQSSMNFLTQRARILLLTFRHASFLSQLMFLSTQSYTAVFRRISALLV